ncbi:MAG: DegT/DnrJ/EryC1/StrS family aminotransferase [bacterium]|nr:DegT/DnrJ/EryC1/StrS family aminotransferase [bacterium]
MHIRFHRPYITEDEIESVVDSLRQGWITMGKKTIDFEKRFSEYIGEGQSVALNSGTAALHLALKCIGLEAGDEVIIPATTFTATGEVVRYFDAQIQMVDIERETHCIDAAKIAEKITGKTKAIIPVHFAGQPADMDEILALAREHDLYVIEDAAHALPSSYKGKPIGTLGDITCFSFYATKTLAAGEGGMAVTSNEEWADLIRILRLHGISKDAWKRYSGEGTWQYDVLHAGYKYNTTDLNSAIALEQLKKLDQMNKQRADIAKRYNRAFSGKESLILYRVKEDRETSWHLYPLKLNLEALTINRDEFIEELKARNIETSVHFIPLYRFSYYKSLGFRAEDYPESEWVFNRIISLPIYPGMTAQETDYVIENVLEILKKNRR